MNDTKSNSDNVTTDKNSKQGANNTDDTSKSVPKPQNNSTNISKHRCPSSDSKALRRHPLSRSHQRSGTDIGIVGRLQDVIRRKDAKIEKLTETMNTLAIENKSLKRKVEDLQQSQGIFKHLNIHCVVHSQ